MSCKVDGCRYLNTHTTNAHKCGFCGEFGHGVRECGNGKKVKNQVKMYKMYAEQEDIILFHCTHDKCKMPHTHNVEAHQPEFEISKYGVIKCKRCKKTIENIGLKYKLVDGQRMADMDGCDGNGVPCDCGWWN
jgi:hypothetical protein